MDEYTKMKLITNLRKLERNVDCIADRTYRRELDVMVTDMLNKVLGGVTNETP